MPGGWIAAIFAGVLLSAYVTEEIGIAVIFGAFIFGMIMPRNAGLTEDVTHRVGRAHASNSCSQPGHPWGRAGDCRRLFTAPPTVALRSAAKNR